MLAPAQMTKLLAQLELHEGLRLKAYRDTVGKWTIGIGYNITDRGWEDLEDVCGRELTLNSTITAKEARTRCRFDAEEAIEWLEREYPWTDALDAVRRRVLVDLLFNVGPGTFKTMDPTWGFLRQGDFETVANRMMKWKWFKQVKTRGVRLVGMMRTGKDYTA